MGAFIIDPAVVEGGGLRDRIRVEAPDPGTLLRGWVDQVARQFSVNRILIAGIPSLSIHPPSGRRPWVLEALTDGEMLDPARHGALRETGRVSSAEVSPGPEGRGWKASVAFSA